MVIDFHIHLAYHKIYPEAFLTGLLDKESSNPKVIEKQLKFLKLLLRDKTGDALIRQMDESGVDKSVLLIIDDNGYLGQPEFEIEQIYELHYNILNKYPDRFYVFAGFHPERLNGMKILKKGIETYGFHGIKLYPPYGFKIDGDNMIECFQYANKMKLNVLSHTGHSINQLKNEYASPEYFASIVDLYPNANFILAHAGYKLNDSSIVDLLNKDNVYADISGFASMSDNSIQNIFDSRYNNKILFGTDWPINNITKSTSFLIERVKKKFLESNIKEEKLLENILYKNALSLLEKNTRI